MPRMTIRRILLIPCIAGLAAAAVSISHAEKASIPDQAAETATYQTTSQMCPAARRPMTRAPRAYQRYLNRTPRMTRRHG